MKIAFFSESYKPYLSGVTNSMETLKNGLEELGHEVLVFSPDYPNSNPIKNVYRYPSIPAPYPGYRLAIPIPKYFALLKEKGVDIIHSHSPYQLGLLSMRYARKLKIPFVFTMHTLLGQYMHYVPLIPQGSMDFISNSYIRWFCNNCDRIIVPTEKVGQHLRLMRIRTKIEIVPTGLDLSLSRSADPSGIREKYGIPKDAKLLIFVGRLAKEKNLEFLFRAFELIRSQYRDVYLLLAAGGPMENAYRKKYTGNIIFTGQITYPKVLDYYAAADVFVFSSLSETQGLVLAEAMACGIPQVAVSAEGVSDVVKDGRTGYLTQLSEEIFASKVLKVLEDSVLWSEMSKRGKEIAKSTYSREVFAGKIELVYKNVL